MLYPSRKHHFDIMFAILCVIAGATSHTVSNDKQPFIQRNSHFPASFMDFILDTNLNELLKSSNKVSHDFEVVSQASNDKSVATSSYQTAQSTCALLSNLLYWNQMKFCLKHQDLLESILPQVIQLTRKECARVTSDLKWNCSLIDPFLDRSNQIAFTKEGALVRSILSASMMYLVLRACSEKSYHSCGCDGPPDLTGPMLPSAVQHDGLGPQASGDNSAGSDFTLSDLHQLNDGNALRLTKSISQHQGCRANVAFASAFTKVFIDSDDGKNLKKSYNALNEGYTSHDRTRRKSSKRRPVDADLKDLKDLAFIRWTEAAVNLHNSNVGRQIVRGAIRNRCRCHGLSGTCQFKTCWDQLADLDKITSQLRSLYLTEASQVETLNLGSYEKPDLQLSRIDRTALSASSIIGLLKWLPFLFELGPSTRNNSETAVQIPTIDRLRSGELIYLYSSPEFCYPLPGIRHYGTKDRTCTLLDKINSTDPQHVDPQAGGRRVQVPELGQESHHDSCEVLCCNRGYRSQLILEMVTCNCRFEFCCKVDCSYCLHQRVQHQCL